MRIKRLELKAFGPFTDKILDFPGDKPGLHVIFGPNETGKSSTLRALKAWLYGFDERTRDNFIHANDQLLVAGLLENDQGHDLYFARRKRRKADLLDADGNPLDPGHLAAMLHGIDRDMFEKLFGLDHETLIRGGLDILEGRGGSGVALFTAGTGITSLRQVLISLQEESDAIFKSRASKPHLNAALKKFAILKTEIGKASLSIRAWKEHDQAFRSAQNELALERGKRSAIDRERRRLERLQQALKPLGLRKELQKRLENFSDVRPLAQDFPDRRLESQERLRAARQSLTAVEDRLREFTQKAGEIQLNIELLDQASSVAHLHQRLGEFRKGMKDRPVLEGKRTQEKTAAGNLWRRIRPQLALTRAEEVRPLLGRRRGIMDLGKKHPLLRKNVETAARDRAKIEDEKSWVETAIKKLPPPIASIPLKKSVSYARRLGEIDRDIAERSRALAAARSRFDMEIKRLGLWRGTPSQLLEVPLPLNETLHHHEDLFRALAEERKALCQRRKEQEQELKRVSREINSLQKSGEVPTEEDLQRRRTLRDQGWRLICRQWLQGENVTAESKAYNPYRSLPEAYEENVVHADTIADRLRREAERVHKFADLTVMHEAAQQELTILDRAEAVLARREAEQERHWQELWAPAEISPLPAAEMAVWLSRMEKTRLSAENILQEDRKIHDLIQQRRQAGADIACQLDDLQEPVPGGEELEPLLKTAQDLLEKIDRVDSERKTLQNRLDTLNRELPAREKEDATAREALQRWECEWRETLTELGLPEKSSPGDVEDFFDALAACLDHLDKAEEFGKRIAGIDRDINQFAAEVETLVERVAPDLAGLPPDQAIEQINGLVDRAKALQTTLKTYRQNIEQAEEEKRRAGAELGSAHRELTELCSQAGCRNPDELVKAEQRWQEQCLLVNQVKETEERLAEIGAGQTLEELEAHVSGIDPDTLPVRLMELCEEFDQIDQKISELDQRVGEERKVLEGMNGVSIAAEKAEEAAECLAQIRRHAEHYIRLRIAAKVLEDEIERYRGENQGPVLHLASRYFAALTLESFDGLRTDIGDKGEQIIVGVKNGRERINVEDMSEGTRDQLFLALRLASLEHRLEQQEAIPFIFDDTLVNFDDRRSEATIKALAKLAERNQVIVFSHHLQVAEAAQDLGNVLQLT